MPKKYKIKDTTIGIKARDIEHINNVLLNGETLAKFGRDAIINTYAKREAEKIAYLSQSDQFHKIKNLEKDVRVLMRRLDHTEYDVNKSKKKYQDMEDRFGAFASVVDERLDISTLETYDEYKAKMRAKWGS